MGILKGKVALVTGGGSGIGRAVAVTYAKEGAKVLVTDIDVEGGEETVKIIEKNDGIASFFKADVSKPEECKASVEKAVSEFGGLHIACNNAGIGGEAALIGDTGIENWQKVISINLSGVFYGLKYQIPEMLKAGGGAIVNIASILGKVGTPQSAPYVAAKHGVIGLTQNAGLEYGAKGIRVNAVGPGYIKTPLLEENLNAEQMKQLTAAHPIGRMGEAEEVAEMVLWLSSDKSSFALGTYYALDGGYLAQ
ncbi:SDR family NAD(P)-dependent oxidoreductase [Portibacter marinus]|uniref:SDR family NAD(P)-dependent oxidoreductase n=1 Tax=Portibacter marinus TaxID=2898660 RepID=UPI001F3949A2|nr:glucose 1-dehydrogenase [Portibacter marinus]